MQKVITDKLPINNFHVNTTPDELRQIAAHLEHKIGVAQPGQEVTMPLTSNIVLMCSVEVKPFVTVHGEETEL